MSDGFLSARARATGQPFVPFDIVRDDEHSVDGKPRDDGTRAFLAARAILLPQGTADDPEAAGTVQGLGRRKNTLVLALLRRGGVQAFAGSVRFVGAVRQSGVEAGRAGGFGFGVDRLGQAAELRKHGATVVVTDLARLLEPR
jgi:beta-phosphoglucomutase-like phosphatase (HAD superfamily)